MNTEKTPEKKELGPLIYKQQIDLRKNSLEQDREYPEEPATTSDLMGFVSSGLTTVRYNKKKGRLEYWLANHYNQPRAGVVTYFYQYRSL